MPIKLVVKGFPEAKERLAKLQQAVRDDATRQAVRVGAQVILVAMQARAPVGEEKTPKSTSLEPGALREGLGLGIKKLRDGYIKAVIGPGKEVAYVARWVEYGHRLVKGGSSRVTVRGATGSGKVIGNVPAYPFLRPALEESGNEALSAFAAKLKALIGEVLS